MGHQTLLYGYIQTDPDMDKFNREVLESYSFEDIYPSVNVFSPPHQGYRHSIIPIAGSFKSLEDDWDKWQSRFENLLGALRARKAILTLEREMEGEDVRYIYIILDSWSPADMGQTGKRRWTRWMERLNGTCVEETVITI